MECRRCEFREKERPFLYAMVFIILVNTCDDKIDRFLDKTGKRIDTISVQIKNVNQKIDSLIKNKNCQSPSTLKCEGLNREEQG